MPCFSRLDSGAAGPGGEDFFSWGGGLGEEEVAVAGAAGEEEAVEGGFAPVEGEVAAPLAGGGFEAGDLEGQGVGADAGFQCGGDLDGDAGFFGEPAAEEDELGVSGGGRLPGAAVEAEAVQGDALAVAAGGAGLGGGCDEPVALDAVDALRGEEGAAVEAAGFLMEEGVQAGLAAGAEAAGVGEGAAVGEAIFGS